MTALVQDDGTGTDANPIGGIYTTLTGFAPLRRVSNKFAGANGGSDGDCAAYTSTVMPNNQYAQVQVDTVGGGDAGPMIRMATGAQSGYFVQNSDGANMYVYSISSGSFALVDSDAAAYATGNTIYLEAQGTSIVSKKNGSTINSATDATLSSGRVGMNMYTQATRFSLFEGGDFSAGASGLDVPRNLFNSFAVRRASSY